MITCEEHLAKGKPPDDGIVWVHALDVTDHCLQGDTGKSFYKDDRDDRRHFSDWAEQMQNRADWDGDFQNIIDNSYEPVRKWQRYDADSGEFNVDQYLGAMDDPDALFFEGWEKVLRQKPAVTVVYDLAVPWGERDRDYMVKRHREVYAIAAQCEAERRPCRVVGIFPFQIPEMTKVVRLFVVLKDYADPIFPAIWGTFINNATTNDFGNVVADYFIGTADRGNGAVVETSLSLIKEQMPEDEEIKLFAGRFITGN